MRVLILPYDPATAAEIARDLRPADLDELRDVAGIDPAAALREPARLPGESWIAYAEGRPIAAFGCGTSLLGGVGRPWMLGTSDVARVGVAVVRKSRAMVARWAARHALLENVVDGRNTLSIAWLRRLGFTIHPPVRVKPGVFAHRFTMKGTSANV